MKTERALVAWDGGRCAARALSDALACLDGLKGVTILTIGVEPQAERRDGRDIVAHLARHGLKTDWRNVPRDGRSIGEAILDGVDEHSAEILVMGAYEHSKFAEDLIGGTTKHVLATARIPVLMSH